MTARISPRKRLAPAIAAALTCALALTGCAAGQRAQTANEFSVIDGVNANAGTMGLRDVGLEAPKPTGYIIGDNASLLLTMVNNGRTDDTLTAVSSPSAAGVSFGGLTTASPGAAPSPSASASVLPVSTPIPIPAGHSVSVGEGAGDGVDATITLEKLTAPLISGQSLTVTFTFSQAGTVTFRIPVKLGADQTGGPVIDVSPTDP